MAARTYFVKVSWLDPNQNLKRVHHNDNAFFDITKPYYEIVNEVKRQVIDRSAYVEDFVIDFMIPTGED